MTGLTRFWFPLVIFFGTAPQGFASPSPQAIPWSDWEDAKTHYDAQNFDKALESFQAHPREDAGYYYNLGTTFFRMKRMGEAIAYLEKANHLRRHDPDIQYNLSAVRSSLSRTLGSEKLDPASTPVEQLADHISLDEVRGLLGLLGIIVALTWIRSYKRSRSLKEVLSHPSGLVGLLAFAITFGVYGVQQWAEDSPPAICLQTQAIRSGPGNQYLELSKTVEGSKVRLLGPRTGQNDESWYQIRFSQDGIGWVRASGLLAL